MKGMELARAYYEQYGENMISSEFYEFSDVIAVGLCGSGSECYGYDDETSTDHDFEPGFCMFIPDEDVVDSRSEFLLSRAYAKLPSEFLGYKRQALSPVGGNRHGVFRMSQWWSNALGLPAGRVKEYIAAVTGGLAAGQEAKAAGQEANAAGQEANAAGQAQSQLLTNEEFLHIPEYTLAEATNGEIFIDELGAFSQIRKSLRHYPDDVRRKKLAGYLLLMEQSGEYNYERCLMHGESGAAQLAISKFVDAAMHVVFLLNDRYMPYYKWSFRAMRGLSMLASLSEKFEYLLTTPNDGAFAEKKIETIASVQRDVIAVLKLRGFTDVDSDNMEQLAYAVNDTVKDGSLRNAHILEGCD